MFDSWESHFYPETIHPLTGSGTLRNLAGYRNFAELSHFEFGATQIRQVQIELGPSCVPHTFDGAHLRPIHGFLFQDVYEWAGQYRSVDMMKGRSQFALVAGGIDRHLNDVHKVVEGTSWRRLNHGQFAVQSAIVFAYLNQAHPFREGNACFFANIGGELSYALITGEDAMASQLEEAKQITPVRPGF